LLTMDNLIIADSNRYLHAIFKEYLRTPVFFQGQGGDGPWDLKASKYLKERIISELHRQYEFEPQRINDIEICYSSLLKTILDFNGNNQLNIFTTNYDSILERFVWQRSQSKFDLNDGFITDEASASRFWSSSKLEETPNQTNRPYLKLVKLHGSLSWRLTVDGVFECGKIEERCFDSKNYRGNILIYPTQKGPESEEPFATLFKYFQNSIRNTIVFVVIGFSFRDPEINRVFLNHLNSGDDKRIIVISPTGENDVKNNLLLEVRADTEKEKHLTKITFINERFGTDNAIEKLRDSLLEDHLYMSKTGSTQFVKRKLQSEKK